MLVVVASQHDAEAAALVQRWRARGLAAGLLTARDLSTRGWCHHVGEPGPEWAVIDGRRTPSADIRGVLTRLPTIRDDELGHLDAGDRAYAAAEMTALLLSWLTGLACPVLNRPTPSSLMGPNLPRERWRVLAAQARLALAPPGAPARAAVTVIGERWLGPVDPALGERAVAVAARAGVALATVWFDGVDPSAGFTGAELFTTLDDDDIAAALHRHLGGAA